MATRRLATENEQNETEVPIHAIASATNDDSPSTAHVKVSPYGCRPMVHIVSENIKAARNVLHCYNDFCRSRQPTSGVVCC